MRQRIGPFHSFRFGDPALARLGRLKADGREAEAVCLARACVEIRDRGAEALPAFQKPGLYDIYRCSSIIEISVRGNGREAVVQDFYAFYAEVP